MKILLIENDPIDTTWTTAFLEKVYAGEVEIRRVDSVEEATRRLVEAPADVILLALQAATARWDQSIKRLDEEQPRTPIIVLAGDGDDKLAAEVFAAGAIEFLVKSQITINWIRRAISYAIHRKRLSDDTRHAENQFLGIINLLGEAIVSVDASQRITLFNLAAEEMFGYSANGALGQPLVMLLPEPWRKRHDDQIRSFAKETAVSRRMNARGELVGLRRNGEIFPVEISISKLAAADGVTFTAIIRDITERKRADEQMRNFAMTDPLTGVANRRRFLDVAEQEIERSRRYDHSVSILMIDIDHFKEINDGFGHAAGDHALLRTTIACHEILRESDVVGRFGGDEFAILLPETGADQAEILARRLSEHIANIAIPYEGEAFKLTVSIGCSTVGTGEESVEEALEGADRALLEAKRTGRNRVVSWTQLSAGAGDEANSAANAKAGRGKPRP
jgi:two-component system cell cycle response regulator